MSMPVHLVDKLSYSSKEFFTNALKVKIDELRQIGELYKLHKELTPEHKFVDHALKNYYSLRSLPEQSELVVVGYFSIIEALITHAPRLTETLDSISHQIRNKIVLLKKRFTRKINYTTYFLEAKEEKIWSLLYSYRSCLAHGNIPNFKTKFQILKTHPNVVGILKEIIKELIILGLKEPDFLNDLKKC